jgi:LAO/AO transport system kinase
VSPLPTEPDALFDRARAGDGAALARLLSYVDRGGATGMGVARIAYRSDAPYSVGLTGAPGAGKSTLTDGLITAVRGGWPEGAAIGQVAVLAVDPTSPFSGGAILGDRVRMNQHALDPTVFIRSMATHGHLGGLSLAVPDAIRLFGAAGWGVVIVETVGVGQMEVDIASAADTTVVVVTPGWGDSMQASKGVREARRDLDQMLDLARTGTWRPEIVETTATAAEGVAELWRAVARHRDHLVHSGQLAVRRADRLAQELRRVLVARTEVAVDGLVAGEEFTTAVKALAAGELDPYEAAEGLLAG